MVFEKRNPEIKKPQHVEGRKCGFRASTGVLIKALPLNPLYRMRLLLARIYLHES